MLLTFSKKIGKNNEWFEIFWFDFETKMRYLLAAVGCNGVN